MSIKFNLRWFGRVLFVLALCGLANFGLPGCKPEKVNGPDMSMGGDKPDLAGALACESMKCENPDAKCCGGEPCVDVTTSPMNCGDCGKTCRARERCSAGHCACTGGGHEATCAANEACCSDGCHQTMTDTTNCGGCGLPCKMGETCSSGKCNCGPAGIACHGSQMCCPMTGCADVQNDPKNCGKCGHECSAGKTCTNGLCDGECVACAMGETCCSESFGDAGTAAICANLLNDANNCGKCGKKCGMVLGIPLPCIFGICAFAKTDGGMDMDAADMSVPHD